MPWREASAMDQRTQFVLHDAAALLRSDIVRKAYLGERSRPAVIHSCRRGRCPASAPHARRDPVGGIADRVPSVRTGTFFPPQVNFDRLEIRQTRKVADRG